MFRYDEIPACAGDDAGVSTGLVGIGALDFFEPVFDDGEFGGRNGIGTALNHEEAVLLRRAVVREVGKIAVKWCLEEQVRLARAEGRNRLDFHRHHAVAVAIKQVISVGGPNGLAADAGRDLPLTVELGVGPHEDRGLPKLRMLMTTKSILRLPNLATIVSVGSACKATPCSVTSKIQASTSITGNPTIATMNMARNIHSGASNAGRMTFADSIRIQQIPM